MSLGLRGFSECFLIIRLPRSDCADSPGLEDPSAPKEGVTSCFLKIGAAALSSDPSLGPEVTLRIPPCGSLTLRLSRCWLGRLALRSTSLCCCTRCCVASLARSCSQRLLSSSSRLALSAAALRSSSSRRTCSAASRRCRRSAFSRCSDAVRVDLGSRPVHAGELGFWVSLPGAGADAAATPWKA